jgi:hypothetical protein
MFHKLLAIVFFHVVYVIKISGNTNVQNKSVISWMRFAGHHPGRSVAGPVSNQAAGNEYFSWANGDQSSRNHGTILMENSRQGHVAQCKALGRQTHKCKCSHRLVAFFLSQCESY